MLGLSPRAARIAWTVVVVLGILALIYKIRETVALFMTALFFAYVLWPAVSFIERHTPRRVRRTLALTIVYLLFIGALVGIGATFGVEWCVVGLDRNWAYNPFCKMAQP